MGGKYKMKISREEIMKVVDNPKTICWSDVLVGLDLVPLFKKYKEEHNEDYYIGKVFMGKTLMNNICDILKERIVKSKDKRIRHLRDKYKLSAYTWDTLQSQPTEAKEDIDCMLLEDL